MIIPKKLWDTFGGNSTDTVPFELPDILNQPGNSAKGAYIETGCPNSEYTCRKIICCLQLFKTMKVNITINFKTK